MINPTSGDNPFDNLPGQLLTLDVLPGGKRTRHSYTISSTPSRLERLEMAVEREDMGLVLRRLHEEIQVGDELKLAAPSGTFTVTGEDYDSIVLVAAGVGITPSMSVIRNLTDDAWQGEIFLLIGFQHSAGFIFRQDIVDLAAKHSNLQVHATMSRADVALWPGRTGRIDRDFTLEVVLNIKLRRVHICGPIPLMETARPAMLDLGVLPDNIELKAFGTAKRKPTDAASVDAPHVQMTFRRASNTIGIPNNQTVLEAIDECGVEIDNAFRSGTCGSCKVKLIVGNVHMDCQDTLDHEDKSNGIILACQSTTADDVDA